MSETNREIAKKIAPDPLSQWLPLGFLATIRYDAEKALDEKDSQAQVDFAKNVSVLRETQHAELLAKISNLEESLEGARMVISGNLEALTNRDRDIEELQKNGAMWMSQVRAYQANRLVCERCGFSGAMVDNQTPGEMMADHFAVCPANAMAAELKGLKEREQQCH